MLGLLLVASPTVPPRTAGIQLLAEANQSYRALHFEDAVRLYRLYLAQNTDRSDVRVYLGGALLSWNQPELALREAQRAKALDPSFAKSYVLLGRIYTHAELWDLADQSFSQALELDGNNAETWYFAGRASYEANRFENAIAQFSRALKLGALQSRTYENLALSYEALGDARQAKAAYEMAVHIAAGTNYRPYLAYGTFLFKQGQSAEALEALQQASTLAPGEIDVCFQLARILYQLKQFGAAELVLKGAVESGDCRVHNLLVRVLSAQGNSEAAAHEVERLKSCFNADAAQASKPQSAKELAR